MGTDYLIFHWIVHFLLVLLLYNLFSFNLKVLLVALVGTILMDVDHLPSLRKLGIKKYVYLRGVVEFGKPRKYFLHNLFTIAFLSGGCFLMLTQSTFYFGVLCLSMLLHLLWDLFEDVFLFKKGIEHWL